MPRNISFMLTTAQIRDRSKTVTRRLGWEFLEAGDVLNGCVKCQGLRKDEKIQRLCKIQVSDVRRESLSMMIDNPTYGRADAAAEGFPHLDGAGFVAMFCDHMRCTPDTVVTRIEFEYIETERG